MKKKYICKEEKGWQFGQTFYAYGSIIEFPEAEAKLYIDSGVKLELSEATAPIK
jgi:hypothetical protein